MNNRVEEFPGQLEQLEAHIRYLEKTVEEKNLLIEWYVKSISELNTYSKELESKVYGGNTK